MATAQASTVLRHIRGFVAAEQASQLPDRQLLERFRTGHEEKAFAALVQRYGPLVWGVCRRVLHNWHDAEDAFQATFLVLARKAGSIRKQESVGSWLYQVAYHAALKARAQTASQKPPPLPSRKLGMWHGCDSRGSRADPLDELTGRELLAVLDSELVRLPERCRAPLVLCYLESQTCDQAARQLGWSLRTLKRRLEQGKKLLGARLARRGLALSTGLLAAALAPSAATATVPAVLVGATVRAALAVAAGKAASAGAVTASVAALAESALRAMAVSKLKIGTALVLAVSVLTTGAGVLVHQAVAGKLTDPSQAEATQPPVKRTNATERPKTGLLAAAAADKRERTAAQAEGKEKMTVVGRVLDADGKPVANAQVAVLAGVRTLQRHGGLSLDREVRAQSRADAEGRFRLEMPRTSSLRNWVAEVVATGAGYGLGWQSFDPDADRPDVVVRVPPEQVCRGRLVDLQGQPAAGVKVQVAGLYRKANEKAQAGAAAPVMHRDVTLNSEGIFLHDPLEGLSPWPGQVATDSEGRFLVRGIGRGFQVTLYFRGDHFAFQSVEVDTSDRQMCQNIQQSLAPARTLEGRVTYADTGKPVPHAHVAAPMAQGQTDAQGRYRLHPATGYDHVIAYAPEGEPYLHLQKEFVWPKGAVKHTVDLALPRGILVHGRVLEEGSGKPVAKARVSYQAQFTNPNLKDLPLYPNNFVNGKNTVTTRADGTFQIACLLGPGYLAIEGPDCDYVLRENGGHDQVLKGKRGGQPWYTHGFVALDLKAGVQPPQELVRLRRGVTLIGSVVGPAPVVARSGDRATTAELQVLCRLQGFITHPVKVRDNRFELHGLDPTETYKVFFLDSTNGCGATVQLSGKQAAGEAVTVVLAPWGSAKARFLDAQGKPLVNFYPGLFLVLTPKQGSLREDILQVHSPFLKDGPHTDGEGRCTLSGLIPGATYRLGHAEIEKTITTEAGKSADLGDIVVKYPQ